MLHHIQRVPLYASGAPGTDPCPRRAAFRMARCASLASHASLSDLMRLTVEPQLLQHLNPFLSPESQARIVDAVGVWLQLVVLEDRLGRLEVLGREWARGKAGEGEDAAAAAEDVRPTLAQVRLVLAGHLQGP